MRKFLMTAIFTALGLAAIPTVLPAQDYVNTPVTISQNKVKKDGVTYYSHIVLERQTLYSIGKAYGVGLDDIYTANPGLRETGLKTNSIILIPIPSEKTSSDSTDPASDSASSGNPDAADNSEQTADANKNDGVETADNPEDTDKKDKKNKRSYFTHTVKWYEDLESIAERYGMPSNVIIYYNNLTSREVTRRQQLKIPLNPEDYTNEAETAVKRLLAGESVHGDLEEENAAASADSTYQSGQKAAVADSTPKDYISAALMLPFNAASSSPSTVCLDFYSGALIAIKELGDNGLNIDLSVYDVYGDILPVTAGRLEQSDFVVGPLSEKGLSDVLEKADGHTFVISPLDPRSENLTRDNSNFVQIPPTQTAQYEDLVKWISEENAPGDRAVVIYEKGRGSGFEENLRQAAEDSGIDWQFFSYGILEGREITNALASKLTETGVNRFLVVSDSEAFVNDVVRNINLLIHNKYNVVLFGESKIRTFETVDVDNLHAANFHCSASYYIDYDSPKVQAFLMRYRALCNAEPSQSAFQGYDIMYYFATMCARYGNVWPQYITECENPMLMSDFKFGKSGDGYIRTAVRRAVYNSDYSVSLIK